MEEAPSRLSAQTCKTTQSFSKDCRSIEREDRLYASERTPASRFFYSAHAPHPVCSSLAHGAVEQSSFQSACNLLLHLSRRDIHEEGRRYAGCMTRLFSVVQQLFALLRSDRQARRAQDVSITRPSYCLLRHRL